MEWLSQSHLQCFVLNNSLDYYYFIGECSWVHDKGEQLKSEGLNLKIVARYKDLELCGSEDVTAKSVLNLFEDLNEEKKSVFLV